MNAQSAHRLEKPMKGRIARATNGGSLLQEKLSQTTLLLEVLAEVNSLMSMGKSFEAVFGEAGKILKEKLRFTHIHIWVRSEEDEEKLRLITSENFGGFREMGTHEGVIGKVVREGRTICLPDVRRDPDYRNVNTDTRSELCVPLMHDGHAIGALNIETATPHTFEGEVPVIELIAENLSRSIRIGLLHQKEEQFKQLVEQMSEGVWVCDLEEQTLYTNLALQKMLKLSEEELHGKTSYDFFDEASKKIVIQENAKRRKGIGGNYEAKLKARDGETVPVILHAVPFGKNGSMATVTDLRAVKTAEKKLFQTERFLASITQHCSEAIVGVDENSIIQSWNVGAGRMFGYKPEEVIGKSISLITPEDRVGERDEIIHETKLKGFARNVETVRLHKNGKPITLALTVSSIKDEAGRLIGFSVLYRDISAQKKWEHELQDRFEKMQEAYREMGRQRRYLDYLMDLITISAAGGHTVKHVAAFIVNAAVMMSKVDAVTLRLLDHETGKLVLTAQSGLTEDWASKKTIPYAGSIVESAVIHKNPLKILDILSDPRYLAPAIARKNNLRSALVVPLEAKGEVIGSLTLYLSHEGNLSLLDDEFISVFAKQAAIALKLAA